MSEPNSELAEDFKRAMRRFVSTVCVLSCCDDAGEPHGLTATSVTSLSLEPPSVLVSVNRASTFGNAVVRAESFCVNVLSQSQGDLARIFGSSQFRHERFADGGWQTDPATGVPVLGEAQANFVCNAEMFANYGSHVIIAGRVLDILFREAAGPLVYFDRKPFAVRHLVGA